jgi:hypothetical protein
VVYVTTYEQTGAVKMAISQAQLRTLRLLDEEAAFRVYRSHRPGDYTWVHERSDIPLTSTLHRLFVGGYAKSKAENRDIAVITAKGRAFLANAA